MGERGCKKLCDSSRIARRSRRLLGGRKLRQRRAAAYNETNGVLDREQVKALTGVPKVRDDVWTIPLVILSSPLFNQMKQETLGVSSSSCTPHCIVSLSSGAYVYAHLYIVSCWQSASRHLSERRDDCETHKRVRMNSSAVLWMVFDIAFTTVSD